MKFVSAIIKPFKLYEVYEVSFLMTKLLGCTTLAPAKEA